MTQTEIVIIGAGAAGIGAALECAERGIPYQVIEAADRVGGRAYTDTTSLPMHWDHGCHWLHSADQNPLVAWADRLGADYSKNPGWDNSLFWTDGAIAPRSVAEHSNAAVAAAFDAIYQAGQQDRDVPIPEVLPDPGPWAPTVRHILQLLIGDDPETDSASAYADYDDTDHDYPVLSGYGDLMARIAKGLNIRLNTPATHLPDTGKAVRIDTPSGTIEARAAIVTASSNVIASGAITFAPGPAADFAENMAHLPCGAFEKVALSFDRLPNDLEGLQHLMVNPGDVAAAIDFKIMKGPTPLMIAHTAGTPARDLIALNTADRIAFATERLVLALGSAAARRVTGGAVTDWVKNLLIQGSYSHALPGHAQTRRDMIEADTGRIGFAGEALSLRAQATAHGAYQSGRDVAARLARYATP